MSRKVKRKRSRALKLVLLPVLMLIGFMGWLLYSLEPRRKKQTKKQHMQQQKTPETQNNDGITFIPTLPQEEQEITSEQKTHN